MFEVRFSPEAKAYISDQFRAKGFLKPGVTIARQGPIADVSRTAEGGTQWNIEHPHPWRAIICDIATFGEKPEDVFEFDGVSVWLALIPKPSEAGVELSVRDGELFVDAIRV